MKISATAAAAAPLSVLLLAACGSPAPASPTSSPGGSGTAASASPPAAAPDSPAAPASTGPGTTAQSNCTPGQPEHWDLYGANEVDVAYDGTSFVYSVTITQNGSCLSGTLDDSYYPTSGPISGTVSGDSITFTFDYPSGSIQGTRTYTGTISQSGVASGTWTQTGDESPDNGTWTLADKATTAPAPSGPPVCSGGASETAAVYASRAAAGPEAVAEGGWAGYVAVSPKCTFTSVTGQWVQPAITCPKTNEGTLEAGFWVGLDGVGSSTVEQTGTDAMCYWTPSGYHTAYRAWYEMFPDDPATGAGFGSLDPQPGSTVKATVIYDGQGMYSLDLTVTTDGQTRSASTEQTCTQGCENTSAEWIVEKTRNLGLPDFKIWELNDAYATTVSDDQEQPVQALKPTRFTLSVADPAFLDRASFDVLTRS